MKMHEYLIEKDYSSVYIYLKQHGFSENYIKNLRKEMGFILQNGQPITINKPLKSGDKLSINANPNTKSGIMHCIIGLDVVFEDEYYLIVNKPAGIATMPTQSHYAENLSGAICAFMDGKIDNFVLRIVNRLDKDTSGFVIVAKDSIAQKELQDVQKIYHAICCGKIEKPVTIDGPIDTVLNEQGYNQHKRVISPDGKAATTFVKPLKYLEKRDLTLAECTLTHGRTHQIRVHLSSINHPLLGDSLYGTSSSLISHTALICKRISFTHPFTKQQIALEVDYPDDIKRLLF